MPLVNYQSVELGRWLGIGIPTTTDAAPFPVYEFEIHFYFPLKIAQAIMKTSAGEKWHAWGK
jgi:hypothetical protein